jgi:predicted nucleic acid-binding protein
LLDLTDEVFPVTQADALRAAEIVQQPLQLSARDALHIAILERQGVRSIVSFDADFDRWPGLRRIHSL